MQRRHGSVPGCVSALSPASAAQVQEAAAAECGTAADTTQRPQSELE
jgi:hypothetical protein